MASKVHYDDNLFFIHSILRTVVAGMKLDIDPEYFKDKIVEDIFFIDATLMRTFSSLKDNVYLINRSSYLRSLRRTVTAFTEFLDTVAAERAGLSDSLSPYHDKLDSTLHAHNHILREINAMLDQEELDEETVDVVSSEEYGFLLADVEASGEEAEESLP
ncbi:MAG: hypothetical protein MI724_15910 [Spirochaetales bacterium]|nr:hypothetical protein [Spirochaetales bacterium]